MAVLCNNVIAGASIADDASGGDAYQIEKSLRIDSGDQANLSLTPGIGNKRTFTISVWFKRPKIGDETNLLGNYNTTSGNWEGFCFYVNTDDHIEFHHDNGSSYDIRHRTTAEFRDPSAWYHAVVAVDTTVSEPSHRVRLYVNGKQITSFNSSVNIVASQNLELVMVPASQPFNIGHQYTYGDAYLSDFYFIDGLALSPAAFGSFDSTGVWNPKEFALPAPNDGTDWSDTTANSSGGSLEVGPKANLFDGSITGDCQIGSNDGHMTLTTGTFPIKATLRFHQRGFTSYQDKQHTLQINDDYYYWHLSAENSWFDIPLKRGYDEVTTFKYSFAGAADKINAIEVDGVILVDGQTDETVRTNIWPKHNDGTTWIQNSDVTFSGNGYGSHPPVNAFDGNLSTRMNNNAGGQTITWDCTDAFSRFSNKKLRLYCSGSDYDIYVNGTDTGTNGPSSAGWVDLGTFSSITELKFHPPGGGSAGFNLYAVEIDGCVLINGAADNSFHLKFNDTSLNRYLGKDTLNGKIADATGGLPIYNTKAGTTDAADYGDVKDTGYRADSSAGTTDGTGLVFAVPGDAVSDIHASINTGSSNTGLSAQGDAAVSTDESRFYGSSLKFDGTGDYIKTSSSNADFSFGTGDFTVELWCYKTSAASAEGGVIQLSTASDGLNASQTNTVTIQHNASKWRIYCNDYSYVQDTAVVTNRWVHVALVRDSGTTKLYVDGVLSPGEVSDSRDYSMTYLAIGGYYSTSYLWSGYIQDVRVYKGVAKYTSNFKPPTRNDFTVNNLIAAGGTEFAITNISSAIAGSEANIKAGKKGGDVLKDMMTSAGVPQATRNQWFSYVSSNNNSTPITVEYNPPIPTTSEFSIYGGSYNDSTVGWTATVTYTDDTTATNSGDSGSNNWWTRSSFSTSGKSVKKASIGANSYANFMGVSADNSNNIVTHTDPENLDSLVDSPTNYGTDNENGGEVRGNYATLNPLKTGSGITLTQGNLYGSSSGNSWKNSQSTIGMNSGKWYVEFGPGLNQDSNNNICAPSVCLSTHVATTNISGAGTTNLWYNGALDMNGSQTGSWASTYGMTEVIGCALDADTGKVWWSINGTWQASGNPATGTNPAGTLTNTNNESFVFAANLHGSGYVHMNFGARAFKYTAPSGFKCLCSQNIDDTFSGNQLNNPSKYFDILTYTGTGASQDIKGLGFQPDLVWIKSLDATYDHAAFDAARGANKRIRPSNTTAEGTDTQTLTAFNSDGYTTGTDEVTNKSGDDYVAWLWDAGTAAVTPSNAGTITPDAQWVNATAGFSISKYESNNTSGATFGHALNAVPEFCLFKSLETNDGWLVYHKGMGNGSSVYLNSNDAMFTATGMWNDTDPTNTLMTLGNGNGVNASTQDYIAYCWTPIAGYSAFGKFTGNANTNGPFIYTGFAVKYVLFKRTDVANDWMLYDRARDPNNEASRLLKASTNAVETITAGSDKLDFLSNGFKIREDNAGMNASGGTYIYAAFAEHPFKTARAR